MGIPKRTDRLAPDLNPKPPLRAPAHPPRTPEEDAPTPPPHKHWDDDNESNASSVSTSDIRNPTSDIPESPPWIGLRPPPNSYAASPPLVIFNPSPDITAKIIHDLADPDYSLHRVAEKAQTTTAALCAWLARPDIALQLDNFESAAARRTRFVATNQLGELVVTLQGMIERFNYNITHTMFDPRTLKGAEYDRRAHETARKAAALLIRLARFHPGAHQLRARAGTAPTTVPQVRGGSEPQPVPTTIDPLALVQSLLTQLQQPQPSFQSQSGSPVAVATQTTPDDLIALRAQSLAAAADRAAESDHAHTNGNGHSNGHQDISGTASPGGDPTIPTAKDEDLGTQNASTPSGSSDQIRVHQRSSVANSDSSSSDGEVSGAPDPVPP